MGGCAGLILLAVVFVPFLLVTLFFNAISVSFERLGLSQTAAFLLLSGSLAGSVVNIPLYRRRIPVSQAELLPLPWFFYRPPVLRQQVIAINLGGAVIPVGLALYLLSRAPAGPTLLATGLMVLICKLLARPHPGLGIAIPPFVPPVTAAALALILARHDAALVAYIAGVLGTIIGADLLNLRTVLAMPAGILSIGGAGVFDGIFLIGMIAVLLT